MNADVLKNDCPTCGRGPGWACAVNGEELPKPHASRARLARTMKPVAYFVLLGTVERGRDYHRLPGYSENGTMTWMTMREAQADARKRGMRAVFMSADEYDALQDRQRKRNECRCAGPNYHPDVPCPVHPKKGSQS